MNSISRLVGMAMVFLAATGCENKIGQCNALVEQINGSHSVIEEGTDFVMHPEKIQQGLKTFNEHIAAETSKIEKVELSDEKLKGYSKQYVEMMREVGAVISEMATATGKLTELQAKVEGGTKSWMDSVTKLKVDCIKQRKQCDELSKSLQKTPLVTGMRPDEDAKKLKEFKDGIAQVTLEEGELKTTRDELVKALDDFSKALEELAGVMSTVEASAKKISEVTSKESPIVDGINGYCGG